MLAIPEDVVTASEIPITIGARWLADAKNGFLRKRPFRTVSKRSTVAPVNLVFGNDPTVFKKRTPRSKSTVFEKDLERSFSRLFYQPSPTSLPHTSSTSLSTHHHNHHTCSRYLRPLYNVTEKYSTAAHCPTPLSTHFHKAIAHNHRNCSRCLRPL